MNGKQVFLKKIMVSKNEQFDNLMKYSMTGDIKYLKRIEGFYHEINKVDKGFKYGLFTNILEDFNTCISKHKENTVSNILNLYGRFYAAVENMNEKLYNGKYKKLKSNEMDYPNKIDDEKILIIDDDVLLLKLIEKSMEERGYNAILCSNPFEAIKYLNEGDISLVILDMILPDIDGLKMTKAIRKVDPFIPIIIISVKNDLETKINTLKMGADDYITKPFNMEEFHARIDRALNRSTNYNILSIEDRLTGVYTKEHFWDRASEKKALYNRNRKPFSIAFIDIDNFKVINDNLGHLTGDRTLRCFAKVLKNALRNTDLIFRFGGDEFIIIFPETREVEAKLVLERFKKTKSCSKCDNQQQCTTIDNVKFSAGITEINGEEDTIEDMLERADRALYDSKDSGGNGVSIYKGEICHGCF